MARAGIYEQMAFDETPAELKEQYFTPLEKDRYKVLDEVKNLVRFRRLDLFQDQNPRSIDLICCRNVIIYFSREAQNQLLETFYTSLTTGGYLILGKTETMSSKYYSKFERINSKERIFRKISSF